MNKCFFRMLLSMSFICAFCAFSAYADEDVQWDSTTYQDHYLDVDGDGIKDLLLQPVLANTPAKLFKGRKHNFSTLYYQEAGLPVSAALNQVFWNTENSRVITGHFNDDPFEDALILLHEQQAAYLLFGAYTGLLDYRGVFEINVEWLSKNPSRRFYPGDFNGDGLTDFIALARKTGKHRVIHAQADGIFKQAQKINYAAEWGLKKKENLIVADFNGDGRDDVFALAKKRKNKHYLIYSNQKGRLKENKTWEINAKFTDFEWLANGFSTAVADENGKEYLIRQYNENGGYDEQGRFIPNTQDKLRNSPCKLVFFKPDGSQSGTKCKAKKLKKNAPATNTATLGKQTAFMASRSLAEAGLALAQSQAPADVDITNPVLSAPNAPTSSVGAYPELNQTFRLSWTKVSHANRYEIWVSYDRGATVEDTFLYTSTNHFDISLDYAGSRFYYVRACNPQGCGGLSAYTSVFAFAIPENVNRFDASSPSVQANSTVTLSWDRPEGAIGSGAYYKIREVFEQRDAQGNTVATQNTWLPNVSGADSTSTNVTLNKGEGQYTYGIFVCNKSEDFCSEESPFKAVTSVLPAPGAGAAVVANLIYTPNQLAVGQTQQYQFDYVNATHCYSANTTKDGVAVAGSVDYVGSSTNTVEASGRYDWQTTRNEAVTWEFDVICENANSSYSQHVRTVIDPNTVPVAIDDVKLVAPGEQAVIRVLDNDFDDDGHGLSISSYTQPHLGSVACTDTCTYTAPTADPGSVTTQFSYTLQDSWGDSVTAQVMIKLVPPDTGILASISNLRYEPQTVAVGETQSFSFDYTNARECRSYEILKNGEVVEGSVVYVADNGELQSGTYSWGPLVRTSANTWDFHVACANNNISATAPVQGEITGNDPPTLNPDEFTVLQYTTSNVLDVLNNDTDPTNDPLTIVQVSGAHHGTTTITPEQRYINYAPTGDFQGVDSFQYTVEDSAGNQVTAAVSVIVGQNNSLEDVIVANYMFEDAGNLGRDFSGNNHHAVVHGQIGTVPGRLADAASFSGLTADDGYITNLRGFNRWDTVTINFWVRTNAQVNNYFQALGYANKPNTNITDMWLFNTYFNWNKRLGTCLLAQTYLRNDRYYACRHFLYPIEDDDWTMVTIVTNGRWQKFYVNKTYFNENNSNFGPSSWNAGQVASMHQVGRDCGRYTMVCANYKRYKADIDNYRIYKRELTLSEITELYYQADTQFDNRPQGDITLTGEPVMGSSIVATENITDLDGLGAFTYQWLRHKDGYDLPIAGANDTTYMVTASDVGYSLSLRITYTDGAGRPSTKLSPKTALVTANAPVGLSNMSIAPTAITIGDAQSFSFQYASATRCYLTDTGETLVDNGFQLLSGLYQSDAFTYYDAGAVALSVTCENGDSSVTQQVSYEAERLPSPSALETQ